MLPDFPHAKRTFSKFLNDGIRKLVRAKGITSVIKEKPVHEGDELFFQVSLRDAN